MPLKFILTGFLLMLFCCLQAQDWDYSYTQYTKNDGLPSNTIYCVTSDKDGILWLGTDAGVVKFDGYNIKVFNTESGLPSNDVFEIVCDSKNRLWLTTFKSDITYIYQDKIHTQKNDPLLKKIGNKYPNARYFEDSDSNLWIRTIKFELYKISNKNKLVPLQFSFKPQDAGYNITEYRNKLYFISRRYSFVSDSNSNKINLLDSSNIKYTEGIRIIDNQCFYINDYKTISMTKVDHFEQGHFKSISSYWNIPIIDSNLWIQSQNGFSLYSLKDPKNIKKILEKNQVSFCHKDSQENIWVSTLSNGLFKLYSNQVRNSTSEVSGRKIIFTSIYVDKNCIYAGTNKGDLFIYKRNSLKLALNYTIKVHSLSSIRILKILKKNDYVFTATDRGISKMNLKNNHTTWIPMQSTALKNFYFLNDSLIILDNVGVRYYKNKSEIDSITYFKRFYSYCEYKNKKVAGSQDSLYIIDRIFKPYPLDISFNYRAVDLAVKDSLLIATTSEKGIFFIKDSTVVKNLTTVMD